MIARHRQGNEERRHRSRRQPSLPFRREPLDLPSRAGRAQVRGGLPRGAVPLRGRAVRRWLHRGRPVLRAVGVPGLARDLGRGGPERLVPARVVLRPKGAAAVAGGAVVIVVTAAVKLLVAGAAALRHGARRPVRAGATSPTGTSSPTAATTSRVTQWAPAHSCTSGRSRSRSSSTSCCRWRCSSCCACGGRRHRRARAVRRRRRLGGSPGLVRRLRPDVRLLRHRDAGLPAGRRSTARDGHPAGDVPGAGRPAARRPRPGRGGGRRLRALSTGRPRRAGCWRRSRRWP